MNRHGIWYLTAALVGLYVALQPNAVKAATQSENLVTRGLRRLASPGVAGLPVRAKSK